VDTSDKNPKGTEVKRHLTDMDRRRFVISSTVAVAALVTGGVGLVLPKVVSAAETKAVDPEQNLCIGCLTCEIACSKWHKSQGLSDIPRVQILRNPSVTPDQAVSNFAGGIGFTQQTCHQCEKPECLAVCPARALRIDATTGARYIDESLCIQCGKCVDACPYDYSGVLASTGETLASQKRIYYDAEKETYVKCDLCRGREGGPACVEQCPVNIVIVQGRVSSDSKTLTLGDSAKINWKKFYIKTLT